MGYKWYFRVHSANVCLSTKKSPMKVKFEVMESDAISGVLGEDGKSARMLSGNFKDSRVRSVVDVDFRFDLFHIKGENCGGCGLLATLHSSRRHGLSNSGLFSLDVEGAELGILQTIPWDQV